MYFIYIYMHAKVLSSQFKTNPLYVPPKLQSAN